MKRPHDMEYNVYRELRTLINKRIKRYLKGVVVWSSTGGQTYRKPKATPDETTPGT